MNRRLRVLFVCAMNKQRSVTAERLYCNDTRLEVRSAGVRSEANRRVSEGDLRWADVVFCMERGHKTWITSRFGELELPRIDVLDNSGRIRMHGSAAAGDTPVHARC